MTTLPIPAIQTPTVAIFVRGGAPIGARSVAERLDDLAGRIGRLSPDWQQPERYFEARSQLQHDARRMARELVK